MSINLRKVGEVADGSVTTEKLADGAVTIAKAVDALRRQAFVGDETEVSVTGVTWVEVKNFMLVKAVAPLKNWQKILMQALIKTNNILYTTSFGLFIDDEVTPRIELTCDDLTYATVYEGSADISDLVAGQFSVKLKLKSSDAAGIASNELVDVFTEI
jgi:hypothetical protein